MASTDYDDGDPNVDQPFGGPPPSADATDKPIVVAVAGAGTMGMYLLLASLSMLFAASIAAYLIIRMRFLRHAGVQLPWLLWVSTILIIVSSFTIQWALAAIRKNNESAMRDGLLATLLLGLAFLVCQTFNWLALAKGFHHVAGEFRARDMQAIPGRPHHSRVAELHYMYAAFYAFTILHALHVMGGLIPLVVVNRRARQGFYSQNYHPGVRYITMYWHFLDVVWIVLFIVIMSTLHA